MKAVILAAGKGSRLGPIGSLTSKAALPLLGKPLVTRVYESLAHLVDTTILVLNPADEHLRELLSSPPWQGSNLRIVAQEKPLGSGDALRAAWPLIDDGCIVTGCDNLMSPIYLERFVEHFSRERLDALVGVTTFKADDVLPSSVVALDEMGMIQQIIEKPTASQLISDKTALPIYAFRSPFGSYLAELEPSERSEYEIPQAIQNLIDQGGVVAAKLAHGRITINNPREYLMAVRQILLELGHVQIERGADAAQEAVIRPPTYIERGAKVQGGARVGPGVYVMSGAWIQRGAVVEDAIVFRDAIVGQDEAVCGKIVLPTKIIDPQRSGDNHGRVRRP